MRCEVVGGTTIIEMTLSDREIKKFVKACDAVMGLAIASKNEEICEHNNFLQEFKNNIVLALNS
jgi:hypothetical protein